MRSKSDPAFVECGDFNNDSYMDLVVVSRDYRVLEIFYQLPNRQFSMSPNVTIQLDFIPTGMDVGDLDGDLKDDILLTSATTKKAYILYQKTNFYPAILKDARPDPYHVVIADFDRNNKNDFIYVSFNQTLIPNSTFVPHLRSGEDFIMENYVRLDIYGAYKPTLVDCADLNNDGYQEIAVADTSSSILVLFNGNESVGVPKWDHMQTIGTESINKPVKIQFVQLDADAPKELAVLSQGSGKITIFDYDTKTQKFVEYVIKDSLQDPTSFAMADLNGDGVPDLVISTISGRVEVYVTRIGPSFGLMPDRSFPVNNQPLRLVAQDIDADGLADLVVSANASALNGSVTIYFGKQEKILSNADDHLFFDQEILPTKMVFGDFDGDGEVEVGTLSSDNRILFRKIGSGIIGSIDVGPTPAYFGSADFNGDHCDDLVISDQEANIITVFFGGENFFENQIASVTLQSNLSRPRGLSIDYISNDMTLDIVVACEGGFQIFYNSGTYPYFNITNSITIEIQNADFEFVATGHFNPGSTLIDVAFYNMSGKSIEIFYQDIGLTPFSGKDRNVLAPGSSNAVSLGTGNINGDALIDIFVALSDSNLIVYVQKAGIPKGFSDGPGSKYTKLIENGILAATNGDLNDDGKDEIATISSRIGTIELFTFDASYKITRIWSFSVGSGLGDVIAADLNQDQRKDLIVSNPVSAAISIYYQKNLPPRAVANCITPLPLVEGKEVQFEGIGTSDSFSDVASLNYTWFFGDGHHSYGVFSSHIYVKNGSYIVTLRVTDRGGLTDYHNLTIEIDDAEPTAHFTVSPIIIYEGQDVLFNDSSISYPDAIVSRVWEFGDGTILKNNETSVSHVFIKDGLYKINLTVTDIDGSKSTYSQEIVVHDLAPSAMFMVSSLKPLEKTSVTFTDLSTSYPDAIVQWFWEFGDGTTSNDKNPVHVFVQNGTFTVKLTVQDSDGSQSSFSIDIEVQDSMPIVSFSFEPITPLEGDVISFTDYSTAHDGVIAWLWDFGDGTFSSERNPQHYYANNGTFSVRLTVTDGDGSLNSSVKQIIVLDTKPTIIALRADVSGGKTIEDSQVAFEVIVVPGWEGAKNLRYHWNYDFTGDFKADEITVANVTSHAFSKKGTYVIAARVWDSDSFSEESITIIVENMKPVARFSYRLVQSGELCFDASLCEDTPSDMPLLMYRWNFDDGSNWTEWSATPIVYHNFAEDGNFSVTLQVKDDDGAIDSITQLVIIDRTMPTIGNINVRSAIIGKPIVILATISDNVGVANATLVYKINNITYSVGMLKKSDTENVWEGQIRSQNSSVTIVFWIEATDTSGNRFSTDELELEVLENRFQSELWIAALSVSGFVIGGIYVYMRRFSTLVEEIFIIYEDGCLIAHDTRRLKPGMDDDVLSSMLVAIQDFVKTSFKDEKETALKRLDFGEKKIIVEKGKNIYLAAVLHGKYNPRIIQRMLGVLEEIEKDYGKVLERWDGDLEKVRGIKEKARPIFEKEFRVPINKLRILKKIKKLENVDLIDCPICGKEIPVGLERCPGCGSELKPAEISDLEKVVRDILESNHTNHMEVENSDKGAENQNH
ncbi:MAG: PKD domain-containing protein [Methanomassiliicoccales archaeon]